MQSALQKNKFRLRKTINQPHTRYLENEMTKAPFEIGDRVGQNELASWNYTGLSGKPGKDKHAVRRFKKGMWVLEVQAHVRLYL